MSRQTLTLDLAPDVFDWLRQRASEHQRPVEEEASLTLASAVSTRAGLPDDLEAALAALSTLDDDVLWQVSLSQPTVEDGILYHALIDARKRRALTPSEEQLLAALGERHDHVMVLRAKAMALLHQRGVDVSERVARA
jgi:plasmid stability protein